MVSVIEIKNIVDPYIIIISPGPDTPTLKASAAASQVPATTGVPLANPVSLEAFSLTSPIISLVHTSLGSCSRSIKSFSNSLLHSCFCMSYKGPIKAAVK